MFPHPERVPPPPSQAEALADLEAYKHSREAAASDFRNVSVVRYTNQQVPEGLCKGTGQLPHSQYKDSSGTAGDHSLLNSCFEHKGWAAFISDPITDKAELICRTGPAANSLVDSSNQETYVYSLLGHTPESGVPQAGEHSLTSKQLLGPFVDQLQLPGIRNKHVRAVFDTCHGRHHIQYLQALPGLDVKLRSSGNSFICQTSSTASEAYGAVFTPAFCALQSADSRTALVESYQVKAAPIPNLYQKHIQMPGLCSFGADVLVKDDLMACDTVTGLYFFNKAEFFQHAVMLVQGVRFDLAARTFHNATLKVMEQQQKNLQVISCLAKMDHNNKKLGIFAVRVPSLYQVVSAHVHYDAFNNPEAINIRETKHQLCSGPSPHIKYYVAKDAPYVSTQDKGKRGLNIKRSLAQTILSQASSAGAQHVNCWNKPFWTGEIRYKECNGEVFVARSGPTSESAVISSDIQAEDLEAVEQSPAFSPLSNMEWPQLAVQVEYVSSNIALSATRSCSSKVCNGQVTGEHFMEE